MAPSSVEPIQLKFEGPSDLVRPESLDAAVSLAVALAFVETLTAVGAYESAGDAPPFKVVFSKLAEGSVTHCYSAVPADGSIEIQRLAFEAWHHTRERLPVYLGNPDRGPRPIAKKMAGLVKAIKRLPSYVNAVAVSDRVTSLTEVANQAAPALLRSTETFRAELLRAGGRTPRVQLAPHGSLVAGNRRSVVLDATSDVAKLAGTALYRQAEVTATLERRPDTGFAIVTGRILDLRVLDDAVDPVAAFDDWYAKAKADTPWANVDDIDEEIRRGRH